jgi:hypothetical protein
MDHIEMNHFSEHFRSTKLGRYEKRAHRRQTVMMKVAQGAAVQSRVTSLLGANLSIQNIHRPVSAEVGDFCGRGFTSDS